MPARCMRSARLSPAPTRSRWPPSSTPSNAWLSLRLDRDRGEIGRLARLADASERINAAARDARNLQLERKPLVFGVFGLLAEGHARLIPTLMSAKQDLPGKPY